MMTAYLSDVPERPPHVGPETCQAFAHYAMAASQQTRVTRLSLVPFATFHKPDPRIYTGPSLENRGAASLSPFVAHFGPFQSHSKY